MSKQFSKDGLSIKMTTYPTPKLQSVFVSIHINTKQNDLLYSLTTKYTMEKMLWFGQNAANSAYDMIAGMNGIVVECPENKITNNILQYITYLKRATIKPTQFITTNSTPVKTNYSSFAKDLSSIEVKILGKCKTFTKNCIDVSTTAPKITRLLDSINAVQPSSRDDVESKCKMEAKMVKANDATVIDALVLTKCSVIPTKDGFMMLGGCCCDCPNTYADTYRAQLKAFRGQFGATGSTVSAKSKVKCEYVRQLGKMISSIKGVEKSIADKDVMKIDPESMKLIKSCQK